MWLIHFLPNWIIHGVFVVSILMIIASIVLDMMPTIVFPYTKVIQIVGIVLLAFSLYIEGGLSNDKEWQLKVKEVEAKLATKEAESAKENTKIVEKVETKTAQVKAKTVVVKEYIDREVVRYDTKFAPGGACEIPKEFVKALNDAATPPGATK